MSVLVVVTLIKMFMGVWNGPASSLGEVAVREAVRRQAVSASVRLMSDKDIEPAPVRAPRTPIPAAVDTGGSGDKPPDTASPPDKVEKNETWWRTRMTQARTALDRDRILVAALENRVSTLTRDAINRDDPVQRAALVAERIRAAEELESMRKQVISDTEAIATIEEEARREGVPPGWIRLN